MGLGGLAQGIVGFAGGSPSPGVPGFRKTNATFNNLLQTYLKAQPDIFNAQETYQPKYTGLDIEQLQKWLPQISELLNTANHNAASGTTKTVTDLAPGAAAGWSNAYRTLNPNTGTLLDSLTRTTDQGLAAGDRLTPADLASFTGNVRSDWASRGLGSSMPAAFSEALAEATGGQNLLNQRISNASGVAALNKSVNDSLLTPTVQTILQQSSAPTLATGLVTGAGPSIVSPGQSQDFVNTSFNANAANRISSANNQAAAESGMSSFD